MRAIVVAVSSAIVSVFLSVPAVAHADPCVNGTARLGAFGDSFLCQDRGWLHVVPYGAEGPNQPIPPGCARFPDKYMCPIDRPPGL
jgi:hypothetical protein